MQSYAHCLDLQDGNFSGDWERRSLVYPQFQSLRESYQQVYFLFYYTRTIGSEMFCSCDIINPLIIIIIVMKAEMEFRRWPQYERRVLQCDKNKLRGWNGRLGTFLPHDQRTELIGGRWRHSYQQESYNNKKPIHGEVQTGYRRRRQRRRFARVILNWWSNKEEVSFNDPVAFISSRSFSIVDVSYGLGRVAYDDYVWSSGDA